SDLKETMTSYPITINSQAVDMSGMIGVRNTMMAGMLEENEDRDRDAVYADYRLLEASEAMINSIKENNLTDFKKYLDDPESEIHSYLGENGIVYSYGVKFKVYSYNKDDVLLSTDADTDDILTSSTSNTTSGMTSPMAGMQRMRTMMTGGSYGAENFTELMPGANGDVVSPILTDSYEVVYGRWPEAYDEVVLVLDSRSSVPADELYQLGLLTGDEYESIVEQIENGETAEEHRWDFDEICEHTFYLIPACDHYEELDDGTFVYIGDNNMKIEALLEDSLELKITGVIRPAEDAANAEITSAVAYTSLLTDHVIRHTDNSAVVLAQEADETVNVLNGVEFEALDDAAKAEAAKEYISGLGVSDKASFYSVMMYYTSQKAEEEEPAAQDESPEPVNDTEPPEGMTGEMPEGMTGEMPEGMAGNSMMGAPMDETAMAAATDRWLEDSPDEELLLSVYDQYLDGSSLKDNLKSFGKVSYDAPASISMYTDSFEDKEAISECIQHYNEGVEEKNQITYTDYVALLTGSITTIIDVISYVLIAFVAVSLIVSSIMIGIITHISVLERTKEIGILRAMGASKRNISQVFNAETVIIGLLAGILGVGVTMLLTIPITSLLQSLLGASSLSASLPIPAALLLIVLSVVVTIIAGLLPSKSAARKDPVAALRTE
ncbi:MAG: ABC transporter permease, partial [Acutalibacter sp.]|nr:ABC transporter permease [Acutalibacter sp.]